MAKAKKKTARKIATKRAAPKKSGKGSTQGANRNPTRTSTRAVTVTMSGAKKRLNTGSLKALTRARGVRLPHGYDVTKRATVSGLSSQMKNIILEDIGTLEAKRFATKLKRDKNKITKKLNELKSTYRKIS